MTIPTPDEICERLLGTMDCPICGLDTPHGHTEGELRHRRDKLPERLAAMADGTKAGFYSGAHRVYGAEYGSEADKALAIDLRQAADLIQQQQATIERLSAALEPFANMADANMNDPLRKWLAVAHIKEAEAALGKDASDDLSPGSSEGE
jgi:hypothetical protein